MCGIVGMLSTGSGRRESPEVLRELSAMMARRGPDAEGAWTDGGPCSLAFRRLAILDLSETGNQPMLTTDGRFAIVFNGELYNFRDLRRELETKGVQFRSSGDVEVALNALALWGPAALERFNGMFALGFYDTLERKLMLARDHAGIKPLHYMRTRRGTVFASQLDQLLRHPWSSAQGLDRHAVGLFLRFGYVPAPYGFFDGAFQVQAGAWLTFDADGRQESGQFYQFPRRTRPDLRGDDAVDAVSEALSRAVARQLVSDVPVGVFLSGGIDSPLVAAMAARAQPGGMKAFTVAVPGSLHDESREAAEYAAALDLEHVSLPIDVHKGLRDLERYVDACTEPTADFSFFPTMYVSEIASANVKVVLSGDGGDELFWGYPERFGRAIEQAPYFQHRRALRLAHVARRKLFGKGAATRDVLMSSVGRLYQRKHTIMNERDLQNVFPGLPELPPTFRQFDFDGTDPDETADWVRWNEFTLHLARVLHKVDRASMYHSLEVRVPLLDREVIDVALRVDWRSCLDLEARTGKHPLRAVLQRYLPNQTIAKKGFTIPLGDWLRGPMQSLVRERLLRRRDLLGIEMQRAPLERLNTRMLAGDEHVVWGLWLLLSLALWEDKYYVARAA